MRTSLSIVATSVLIMCQVGQLRSEAVAVPLSSAATVTPSAPAARETIRSNEVSLETPTGTLFGTLMLPAASPPVAVVLLVAGSGMTDRDGNTVGLSGKSNTLKLLAEALAQSGIASLRYDKRGVARSAPARTSPNSFETQADDAARWVAWLGQSPDFRSVGIVGHSEGSCVGIMAAQRAGVRALVSLAGAGRRFDEVMVKQEP